MGGGLCRLLVCALVAGATLPVATGLRQGQPPSTILDKATYRYEPGLGIFVPGEMNERHDLPEELVEPRSTYSNLRRFRVDTSFTIK